MISTTIESISPKRAAQYLECRNGYQRKVNPRLVARYKADMETGRWGLTHQGIAFDEDGFLIDGQHRLQALFDAGCTLQMMVTRNVPRASFADVDNGKPKSISDISEFSNSYAATARVMSRGDALAYIPPSNVALLAFIDTHREALDWTQSALVTRAWNRSSERFRLRPNAMCRGAVARAYYYVPLERLERFCWILVHGEDAEGEVRKTDGATLRLRDHLLAGYIPGMSGLVTYRKTEIAIAAFTSDRQLKLLKVGANFSELYPLPEGATA